MPDSAIMTKIINTYTERLYDMEKVVILDDSISYFTDPSQIQKVYGKFWDEGISISLAITPALRGNVHDGNRYGIPTDKQGDNSPFKVTDNKKLCNYLNVMAEQRLVEICIRGHNGNSDEFDSDDDVLLQQKIEDGKSMMQSAFPAAEINTFLLPEKTYSDTAIQLLTEYDFNLCTYSAPDSAFIHKAVENSRTHFSYSDTFLAGGQSEDIDIAMALAKIDRQDFIVIRQHYSVFYESGQLSDKPLFNNWLKLIDMLLELKNLEIDTFTFI